MRLGLLICALGLTQAASAERAPAPPPYGAAEASADTLRYSVRAGETLIVALPGRVAGADVSYEVIQAPALSWLVDRSFMWRTLARERGTLPVRLRRIGGGRAAEEVVLLVEITG
ncbi:hypothetical protein BSZ37_13420 [Rubrivirga marina]|uniref:Uncharacterized protein n=1 Tax=Rubrivirga marina TaxID=1196024 RepID=A0A271J1J0_9BACT|nr:hypothetical protein BSZ37_13420 [Rubrivirga marina]